MRLTETVLRPLSRRIVILVVEDHEDTRRVLVRLLQHDGYEAVGVADGQQALLFLQTHKPHLMILDCDMPCVDGLGVLRTVRADERLREIPVVMFTADAAANVRLAVERLGVQGWVTKGSLD